MASSIGRSWVQSGRPQVDECRRVLEEMAGNPVSVTSVTETVDSTALRQQELDQQLLDFPDLRAIAEYILACMPPGYDPSVLDHLGYSSWVTGLDPYDN